MSSVNRNYTRRIITYLLMRVDMRIPVLSASVVSRLSWEVRRGGGFEKAKMDMLEALGTATSSTPIGREETMSWHSRIKAPKHQRPEEEPGAMIPRR